MEHQNLAQCLSSCSAAAPDRGLTFHEDSGAAPTFWSYPELELRARTLAAELLVRGCRGQRVFLVYQQGLEFVAALFGCFYAGAIAVPVHPPSPARLARTLPRFLGLLADARPALIATTGDVASLAAAARASAPALAQLEWLVTDAIPASSPTGVELGAARPDDIAFLQYTSGSTAAPKGVILTHANLLANSASIRERLEMSSDAVMVSWLPFQHDMGLIGGLLQMIYCQGSGVYFSPTAFLSRPSLWMELASRHRATLTGGPNFAYDLAARRTSDAVIDTLDLRALRTLYCGAEPIRAATLERFVDRFARVGVARRMLAPCYGLAESSLLVSFERVGVGHTALELDAEHLDRGLVTPRDASTVRSTTLVACGPVGPGAHVRIVDPERQVEHPAGRVGEIWVAGPSVSPGYFNREDATRETMGRQLAGSAEAWLRTGDLGFFHEERLFVTGRLKDLIIVRGRNIYPQDLEGAAELAHRAVRPGCSVAFGVEVGDQERVALVAEVDSSSGSLGEVVRAIRRGVQESQDVTLQTIVLVKSGSLAKTSSGKVQRQATKRALALGELEEVGRAVYAHDDAPVPHEGRVDAELASRLGTADARTRQQILETFIVESLRPLLPIEEQAEVGPDRGFFELGLGSLAVAELTARLELHLGRPLTSSLAYDHPTAARLAAHLAGKDATTPSSDEPAGSDGLDELLDDLESMSDADVTAALKKAD